MSPTRPAVAPYGTKFNSPYESECQGVGRSVQQQWPVSPGTRRRLSGQGAGVTAERRGEQQAGRPPAREAGNRGRVAAQPQPRLRALPTADRRPPTSRSFDSRSGRGEWRGGGAGGGRTNFTCPPKHAGQGAAGGGAARPAIGRRPPGRHPSLAAVPAPRVYIWGRDAAAAAHLKYSGEPASGGATDGTLPLCSRHTPPPPPPLCYRELPQRCCMRRMGTGKTAAGRASPRTPSAASAAPPPAETVIKGLGGGG
ncbi:translation initiation factor IF-2-like [Schistocerca nitens]|uniref:translation initiation factor IF-2-like n=1 Tax=Schistocerca nitens TaxID=7011 RepID=UPI0021196B00|nr:translation initiation factor IF-2-like [Schistocerca nitens]